MEFGTLVLLLVICLGIFWVEGTKTGERFINWFGKKFVDIDVNELSE